MTQQSRSQALESVAQQSQGKSDDLSKDQLFHILSCRRRRDVLRYLADYNDRVSMSDLADQVAAWEHETTVANLNSDERKSVYIGLYQIHLPALDEYGIIDYNKPRGIIKRTQRADQLDLYLREDGETNTDTTAAGASLEDSTDSTAVGGSSINMNPDPDPVVRTAVVGLLGAIALVTGWFGIVSTELLLSGTWIAIGVGIMLRQLNNEH